MSKLNIDQKNIIGLFSDKRSDFLIPDYQRPYAWGEFECLTLWNDIFDFAFPGGDYTAFKTDDEYFLGPIVVFKNSDSKLEIIDGQQRLTSLMLLLRAFYERFGNMQDKNSLDTRAALAKCIWKTDEFGTPDRNALKINSEVATDEDKDEFLEILKSGKTSKEMHSIYALNYRFFQKQIEEFLQKYPSYFAYLPIRILNNCVLLPIEAESQETALRIFSTLNDRGLPLSDADIFKAKFYEYYKNQGKKYEFIERWKNLEKKSKDIFYNGVDTPMDELFIRYMYYERAKQGIKNSTTEALRKFYEKDKYSLLKKEDTLSNLEKLADFWMDVENQDKEKFSDRILKRLFVLHYAPNGTWADFVSVYFLHNKDINGSLEEEKFYNFLTKITAFIWMYAVVNPGVNALRTPVYAEMVNIVKGKEVCFYGFEQDRNFVENSFKNYSFSNIRPITKSMLTWWAFMEQEQEPWLLETKLEIEHIFPRNRQELEKNLSSDAMLEKLGNKALLEKRINIRASDYRFEDKLKYYSGYTTNKGVVKEPTKNKELFNMAKHMKDFVESDIQERDNKILGSFFDFLDENKLIK